MSERVATGVVFVFALLLGACLTDEAQPAEVDAGADSGASMSSDDSGADGGQVGPDAGDGLDASADGGDQIADAGAQNDSCAPGPTADGGNLEQAALQNATATFSQASFGGNPVGAAIDGVIQSNNGWGIYEGDVVAEAQTATNRTKSQTAVFETVADVTGETLTIRLHHVHPYPGHSLGRFRISVTDDARSEFADAQPSGGDVTANWVALKPLRIGATEGITLSVREDDSVLAQGAALATEYTISAANPLEKITGLRVEALADPSLPDNGPGLYTNGNFVLTEIFLELSPERLLPECH